ncbi:YchJ family metal-binding protein [Spongiibacter taiwanensis]|uniref:YchJ family protein n=1 Tax=Spongiibacter taiwanensis TaxID=1748242 RepID=UPI002035C182|nr:YchJ family metal-binding protein [Spongiibacter taiwanensis]USA43414.1 YchJ family metal-binding protein [Spongiibacter taiwanensis]
MAHCPCGSGLDFEHCCGVLIRGERLAQSPEELMRSRYSAFATGEVDYLIHTWLQPPDSRDALAADITQTRWTRLVIVSAPPARKDQGEVEFAAFCQTGEASFDQLHERSRFVFQNGRWHYVDGKMLPPIKLGRNEPCYCGSGLKRKACHPN